MHLRQDPRRAGVQLLVTVYTVLFLPDIQDSVPSFSGDFTSLSLLCFFLLLHLTLRQQETHARGGLRELSETPQGL